MATDKTKLPREVMHYTSVPGFQGIVQSGTLFATSIVFLNDRRELRFVDDLIRAAMAEKYIDVYKDVKAQGIFTREFDLREVAEKETTTFLERLHAVSIQQNPIFVCSFCRPPDDDEFVAMNGLLSQWRGYGSDGGIAICLSRQELEQIVAQENELFEIVNGYFGDVIYGPGDPEFPDLADELATFSNVVPDIVESVLRSMGHKYEYRGEKATLDKLWLPYFQIAPRLKHPGFREEMEYRIAISVARDQLQDKTARARKGVHFRVRGNYLAPYVLINEAVEKQTGPKNRGPLPITRVIVGPSTEGERRRDSVVLLLREHGYDVPVDVSETPFA